MSIPKTIPGWTALICACSSEHTTTTELVNLLVARGADINAEDQYGRTPLMLASGAGNDDVVKVLLDRGVDIDAKDTRDGVHRGGGSPKGYFEVVRRVFCTRERISMSRQRGAGQH